MLDGVGLTAPHPQHPLVARLPTLERLGITAPVAQTTDTLVTRAVDARLGVEGLPQSGTGQTTILSGVNAAAAMNRHYGPWISPSLKRLLAGNILERVSAAGGTGTGGTATDGAATGGTVRLANYYPERYLESLETGAVRLNAIATAALGAGARLEGAEGLGIPPMLRDPNSDATPPGRIADWARAFVTSAATVTIFDEWWTDSLGHEMNLAEGLAFAARLEIFCEVVLREQPADVLFLVSSDHGNFEDLSVKTHTLNPVPLAAVGVGALEFARVTDLTGIAPALGRVLKLDTPSG